MFESIHNFKDINLKKQYIKYILRNKKKKYFSINNNNDTFDIFMSLLSSFKIFMISICKNLINYIGLLKQFIFKCHFLVLLIFMLFTFVFTFDNNSDIPTNLIISAYFPNNNYTRITYDMLINKEKENKVININYEDHQKIFNHISNDKNCNSCKEFQDNKNIQNNVNNNKFNEDSSLKEMLSKVKKQKYNLPFWNSLMAQKNINNYIFHNQSFKTAIISVFSFLYFYFFIKLTIYSKIKDSFIFNVFSIAITFNLLNILYQLEFFSSSAFFFILLMYNNKCLIESVYINLKYNRKDFEIFSSSLIAFNFLQFCLKIIILLNLTTFSGILSIFFFRIWINYILFYICLFTLVIFFANCLESVTVFILKPIKNILIFILGILNLIFSKILLQTIINKSSFLTQVYVEFFKETNKIDSLYLISDLFTLFCFGYIRGYLEFQIESILLIDHFIDNNDKLEQEIIKLNEAVEKVIIWPVLFLICLLLCVLDIYKKEKLCLFLSIYLSKILIVYFSNAYDNNIGKYLYYVCCLIFIIFNIESSTYAEKTYLINLFHSFTRIDKEIISMSLKIFISLMIFYFIITVNFNIASASTEKMKFYNSSMKTLQKETEEITICNIKIEKKYVEIINFFDNCVMLYLDLLCNYFLICLLIALYQYYEDSIIIKIADIMTIIILFITKLIYLQEISNIFDYYYSNYIWLWLSLRLISLCNSEFSVIFCLAHLNLQIFLYYFYVHKKDNSFLNILFLLTVIIRCWQIYPIFLITYIFIIIFVIGFNYIYNNINYLNEEENSKNNEQKDNNENFGITNIYVSLSFLFLIPIISFFLIYFKFPRYHFIISYLDKVIKDFIYIINEYYQNIRAKENFDWIDSIEFNFIDYMVNFMERLKSEVNN